MLLWVCGVFKIRCIGDDVTEFVCLIVCTLYICLFFLVFVSFINMRTFTRYLVTTSGSRVANVDKNVCQRTTDWMPCHPHYQLSAPTIITRGRAEGESCQNKEQNKEEEEVVNSIQKIDISCFPYPLHAVDYYT